MNAISRTTTHDQDSSDVQPFRLRVGHIRDHQYSVFTRVGLGRHPLNYWLYGDAMVAACAASRASGSDVSVEVDGFRMEVEVSEVGASVCRDLPRRFSGAEPSQVRDFVDECFDDLRVELIRGLNCEGAPQ